MNKRNIIALFLCFAFTVSQAADVVWFDGNNHVAYTVLSKKSRPVEVALDMFEHDMRLATGKKAREQSKASIEIYQLDNLKDKEFNKLSKRNVPVSSIITHSDAFYIGTEKGKVIVVGSNARGTAYGILRLSELAGVNHFNWWLSIPVQRQQSLSLPDGFRQTEIPAVEWRGLSINDIDSCLSDWSRKVTDHHADEGEVGHNAWRQIFRLMLRLRLNSLELAGKADADAYFTQRKAIETADSCEFMIWTHPRNQEQPADKNLTRALPYGCRLTTGKDRWTVELCHNGKPHSWSYLSFPQPGMLIEELQTAYDNNIRTMWLAQLHHPKHVCYQLQLFADMAWNPNSINADAVSQHLEAWLNTVFTSGKSKQILPLLYRFNQLTAMRKTEQMAWGLVRSPRKNDTNATLDEPFNPEEFGNELARYIAWWKDLAAQTESIERIIDKTEQDAFFTLVGFPIETAALAAEKQLQAQEANELARTESFHIDDEALTAATKSTLAHQKLLTLNEQMNTQAAQGKWNGTWKISQVNEIVYGKPRLPDVLSAEELKKFGEEPDEPFYNDNGGAIAMNASQYSAFQGKVKLIQMAGHSQQAVKMLPGAGLTYQFETQKKGEAVLRIAFLPTPLNATQELRFALSVDGGNHVIYTQHLEESTDNYRRIQLRNQIIQTIPLELLRGKHKITITALEDAIIADQIMIDYKSDRKFYLFPTYLP